MVTRDTARLIRPSRTGHSAPDRYAGLLARTAEALYRADSDQSGSLLPYCDLFPEDHLHYERMASAALAVILRTSPEET